MVVRARFQDAQGLVGKVRAAKGALHVVAALGLVDGRAAVGAALRVLGERFEGLDRVRVAHVFVLRKLAAVGAHLLATEAALAGEHEAPALARGAREPVARFGLGRPGGLRGDRGVHAEPPVLDDLPAVQLPVDERLGGGQRETLGLETDRVGERAVDFRDVDRAEVEAAELAREVDAAEHAGGLLVALLAALARGEVARGAGDQLGGRFGAHAATCHGTFKKSAVKKATLGERGLGYALSYVGGWGVQFHAITLVLHGWSEIFEGAFVWRAG